MNMRRLVLRLGCLATFLAPLAAGAQSTGASADDVARWAAAWNSHDIAQVEALFAPGAVIDQPSNPKPLGRADVPKFFGMIFTAYPDFHVDVQDAVLEGWKAVTIERVTGHWRGPYTDPATGTTTPPNGRAFDHPGAMYIVYGPDHKITRLQIFWDTLVVDKQLGVVPK
jgi:steroid delta-isomerase-like uncharacterized protein